MRALVGLPKYTHRETTVAVYRRAVTRVIAHLTANLGEDQTLKDLADVAMLSPFHFNRIFRDITGVSPVRYLYAMRLAEAERQILTTRLKVIDVCYGVGYKSLGSFNNRFVSLIGYSPRQIRNLAGSIEVADLRRLIHVPRESGPLTRRKPCSIWGTIHVPPGFSGIVMVALFPGPPSNCYPIISMMTDGESYALPPVRQAGNFFVMAVGLSWHDRMADFLMQPGGLRATMPPIFLSASGLSSPIDFHLAPSEIVDPPMPPSLPFQLIDQVIRMPAEPQEECAEALPLFFRNGSPAVAQPLSGAGSESDRPLWPQTEQQEIVRRPSAVH